MANLPEKRTTLLRAPPIDPGKALIENSIDVTALNVFGPDVFTNTYQPWFPPGARGIYGGNVIAQCLNAAFKTVGPEFLPHSMHCYFLLAGSGTIPIMYHVERVRDGRSFATRTVQARQRGACIFTTTISFTKEGAGGKKIVSHAATLPEGLDRPTDDWSDEEPSWLRTGPCQSRRFATAGLNDPDSRIDARRSFRWSRCRGTISSEGGSAAHLSALAYMTDSYFLGTVARINKLWHFGTAPEDVKNLPEDRQMQIRSLLQYEGLETDFDKWVELNSPSVGMLVSLDHSIYFHEPTRVKADEWMFAEMESPWSGDGRGVVSQRIYAKDGTLLASCFQEGVIRLKQDEHQKKAKL